MLKIKIFAIIIFLISAIGFSNSSVADNKRQALVCIGTETGETVNFQFRWGTTGRWSDTIEVEPGYWRAIIFKYSFPSKNKVTQLQIKYNDNLTNGVHNVISNIKSYDVINSNCNADGKKVMFFKRGSTLFTRNY